MQAAACRPRVLPASSPRAWCACEPRRGVAQVDQTEGAAGGVLFDDEPDWEGGRARERKGLKWNKASKTGFDALVRRGLMSAASIAFIAH